MKRIYPKIVLGEMKKNLGKFFFEYLNLEKYSYQF